MDIGNGEYPVPQKKKLRQKSLYLIFNFRLILPKIMPAVI